MTPAEIEAVALVVSEVDGNCTTCVASAAGMLRYLLPDIDWATAVWTASQERGRLPSLPDFDEDVEFYAKQAAT